ncbi:MAG: 23S rRNA (adenine(2030)-N(6))-methyltransferase RlmJ [Rhizobiales bacterium]|nr:23S rRNA (adenine(2030)-N(6))-methyltransferase RlmJ [Hyphomicrobiales bacterium]
MNYRHAYHAGNHADVLKHVILARVLAHLKKKEKPFHVIDAHAGTGVYALDGVEAGKTGEWQGGIGKMADPFADDVETLLMPYREGITALNPGGRLIRYPGSPWIAARLMGDGGRMVANELHPVDKDLLVECFRHDARVRVTGVDAEMCIKANLPPPERRGLVLIDPPYEQQDEADRAVRMLAQGLKRFATGCFMLWYPLKADGLADRLCDAAQALAVPGTLRCELRVRESFREGGLAGSGLVIVNPPWKLDNDLALVMPALAQRLGLGNWGQGTVSWLLPPK